jgi:hypothetical protein
VPYDYFNWFIILASWTYLSQIKNH